MFVEKAYVISLKIRADRRVGFFDRYPGCDSLPEIEVWNAVHGDTCPAPDNWHAGNGAWGCYRTHMNILEHCLNEGIQSYIVFEDDAVFTETFAEDVKTFFEHVPDDWDQAYLGGQLLHTQAHPPIKVNDHVYRPYNVNRTHCFALNGDAMVSVYRHCSNLPFHTAEHIDHHLGRWHETYRHNVFCPARWIVGQGGASSNVSGKKDPVTFYENPETRSLNHPLYERPACIVLRGPRELSEKLCASHGHKGYNLDRGGYDRSLCEAWKYKDPSVEIKKWFSCIRSEIARESSEKLPLLWHPRITDEMIADAEIGRVLTVETDDYDIALETIVPFIAEIWR